MHPLAVKLGKREWENEVARNILVLYKANMNAQRKLMEEPSRISSKPSVTSNVSSVVTKKTPEVLVSLGGQQTDFQPFEVEKKIWQIT